MAIDTDLRKSRPFSVNDDDLANRDPISGAPGAHPVGVGVGAVGGAATGAAIGAMGGPVGFVVGGAVGAVVGGMAGKAVAEEIDPTIEDTFWRDSYISRPYVRAGSEFRDYQPAYRYGWETASRYPGKTFDDIEREIEGGWTTTRGDSSLTWKEAKLAARDAWERARNRPS